MDRKKAASLVEESLKSIYAYAAARVTCREDAEDLGGNIIVAVLESCDSIRNEEAFFAYLWSIADNTLKNYYRKKSKIMRHTSDEDLTLLSDEDDFTEDIERREEINALRRELSLLSREHRVCTVDYYINDFSCSEIAKRWDLSVNMVKYYLFKTRKILKEGITMERNFGEKSYTPVDFKLRLIFTGTSNESFYKLLDKLNSKLSGNILASAYYTPCTIRELSIELGVSTVYMEDEVASLEKFDLIKNVGGDKYQTNLLILDGGTRQEFIDKIAPKSAEIFKRVIPSVKGKLGEIRDIGFIGSQNSDNRIMWSLAYLLINRGNDKYKANHAADKSAEDKVRKKLYEGATGVYYGDVYSNTDPEISPRYQSGNSASWEKYDEIPYKHSFVELEALPDKNNGGNFYEMVDEIEKSSETSRYICFTESELEAVDRILAPELDKMARLWETVYNTMRTVIVNRAPKYIQSLVDGILPSLYHQSLGIICGSILDSGELDLPNFDYAAADYFTKE